MRFCVEMLDFATKSPGACGHANLLMRACMHEISSLIKAYNMMKK